MKKTVLFLTALLLVSVAVSAQTDSQEKYAYTMKTVPGPEKDMIKVFSISYAYAPKDIETAILQKLKTEGLSYKKAKNGFYAFKGVRYNALWNRTCDFYISITGTKSTGTIYFAISQGYDNFMDDGDADENKKISDWLVSLDTCIKNYLHNQKIDEAEQEVQDASKEIDKIKSQKDKAEKSVKDAEDEIKAFEAQRTVVDNENLDNVDTKVLEKEKKLSDKLNSKLNKLKYDLEELKSKFDKAIQNHKEKRKKLDDLKTNRPN